MKCAVLYFSHSGTTKAMAKKIAEGMMTVADTEAKTFPIDDVDADWVNESSCVVIGTPTYYADVAGKLKMFLESLGKYQLAGKLGGAFATAAFIHGGAEIAIQSVLTHMMFNGMMVYSGGGTCGNPPIHLGPVFVPNQSYDVPALFKEYGTRIATQASKIFN